MRFKTVSKWLQIINDWCNRLNRYPEDYDDSWSRLELECSMMACSKQTDCLCCYVGQACLTALYSVQYKSC